MEIVGPFSPDTGKDCWYVRLDTLGQGVVWLPLHSCTLEHAEERAQQLADLLDLDSWRPPLWTLYPYDWTHLHPTRQRPDPTGDPRRCRS